MSAPDREAPDGGSPEPGPLPNRFTRSTALGCLGLAGVFALPGLLFLPLEDWRLPNWLTQLMALGVFAALAGGAWLLVRVPSGGAPRARDAQRPLTRSGQAPVVERPAERGNRATVVALAALVALAAVGYLATGAAATVTAEGASLLLVVGVGVLCIVMGGLVAVGRVPVPAWTWARTPIQVGLRPQGVAIALFGLALLGWALLGAAGVGFRWGVVGLAVLLLASVVVSPLAQRWPRAVSRSGDLRDRPPAGHEDKTPPYDVRPSWPEDR
jgi:hypothetical protein